MQIRLKNDFFDWDLILISKNSLDQTILYTENKSFAGSSLPANTKALCTNGLTDGHTLV